MTRTIVRHAHTAITAGLCFIALLASPDTAAAQHALVQDLRVGEHPGSTRVVLDISEPSEMTFAVSDDGRNVVVGLPKIEWRAGAFAPRHAKGALSGFRYSESPDGGFLKLAMREPVKIKSPFFVSPEGNQGHRVVIDIVPDVAAASRTTIAPAVAASHTPAPTAAHALGGTMMMEPPTVIDRTARMVAGPATIVPLLPATTAPQTSQAMSLSPGSAARPIETAQATQPRPQQPPIAPQAPMQRVDDHSPSGFLYAKLGAGLSMLEEADASGAGNNAAVETDIGWGVLGGLGIDLKNNFRVEGEAFYITNAAQSIRGTVNGSTANSGGIGGDVSTLAFMGNLAYDFVNAYAITPYIFGGAGLAMVSVNNVAPANNVGWDDSDWVFALQGGLGVAFDVSDRLSLDLGYRYFETLELELSDATGVPFNYENASHMFMLSARYKF